MDFYDDTYFYNGQTIGKTYDVGISGLTYSFDERVFGPGGGDYTDFGILEVAPVPEPSSYVLMFGGIAFLAAYRRNKK